MSKADAVDVTVNITYENVRFYGHYNAADSSVKASWPNSGVVIRFSGSALTLMINSTRQNTDEDAAFVQVWVDGERTSRIRLKNGTDSYTVISGLNDGEHIVKVLCVVELNGDYVTFSSLTVRGKEPKLLTPKKDEKQLKFDIFGDSITAGFGSIPGHAEGYRTSDQDSSITSAAKTVDYFNGDGVYKAISGWGCLQGWNADTNGIIPRVWKRAEYAYEAEFDFSARQADIVIINLGTNDAAFNAPKEKFIDAYVNFLLDIRSKYKNAYIFCVYGMMNESYGPYVKEAAERFTETDKIGAVYVHTINMSDDPKRYTGSGGHPSGEIGTDVSKELIKVIEKIYFGITATRS